MVTSHKPTPLVLKPNPREEVLEEDQHYHGGSPAAVPFTWESQPGTPKASFHRSLPHTPLTPPPSYFYSSPHFATPMRSSPKKKKNKRNFFDNVFFSKPWVSSSSKPKSKPVSPVYSSSSSHSSASSSSVADPVGTALRPRPSPFSSSGPSFSLLTSNINNVAVANSTTRKSSFGDMIVAEDRAHRHDHQRRRNKNEVEDEEEEEEECSDLSPVSTLCFGGGGPGRGGGGAPRARAGCYASIFKVLMLRDA
ncbi:hypothetical protein LINGRAHAP2_LOCUS21585 [Linum grandiflorum]